MKRNDINLGLKRISLCLKYLGNPQNQFKSVLIAGTNGKGSVTYYLSNLACKYSDLKIGRYISPHLISVNERFVINEKIISLQKINSLKQRVLKKIRVFEKNNKTLGKLTEFEILTIIAFKLFEERKVDIAFLEVGLGGRLDATNVIESKDLLCSVITNISLDHTDYLGKTIKKIAFEKAGIIKKNNHLVTAATGISLKVIKDISKKNNAHISQVVFPSNKIVSYKEKNIWTAIKAWEIISSKIKLESKNTKEIYKFLNSLEFKGRFQHIKKHKMLLDGAHNPHAASELKKRLNQTFKNRKIVYIFGILDKDYKGFIDNLFSRGDIVICTKPKSTRATKLKFLTQHLKQKGCIVTSSPDLKSAIKQAKTFPHDLIVITGSLYLVGAALKLFRIY